MELVAIDRGLGHHIIYLDAWQRQQQSMYNSISQCFCIMSLTWCKISICISLLRIIEYSDHLVLRTILFLTMALVFVVNHVVVVTLFTQCRPTAKVWNSKIPGTCWKFPIELYVAIMQGGKLASFMRQLDALAHLLQLSLRSRISCYHCFPFSY